jgi:hypothetical protein
MDRSVVSCQSRSRRGSEQNIPNATAQNPTHFAQPFTNWTTTRSPGPTWFDSYNPELWDD